MINLLAVNFYFTILIILLCYFFIKGNTFLYKTDKMAVKRFGVSLSEEVLNKLDNIVTQERFPNRSRAISHLISEHNIIQSDDTQTIVTGAVVLVYDHRISRLHVEVASLQHEYNCLVLSSQHIHLDAKNCIETIAVRGTVEKILKLSRKLMAIKGIQHGNVVFSPIE